VDGGKLYDSARKPIPLRPKINAILGSSTETNAKCKMTKIPLVLYEKDLAIDLSFTLSVLKKLTFRTTTRSPKYNFDLLLLIKYFSNSDACMKVFLKTNLFI
jgi:hypothetical protein